MAEEAAARNWSKGTLGVSLPPDRMDTVHPSWAFDFDLAVAGSVALSNSTPFAHGMMNWTKDNHWGYTLETGVMLKVVNGDWKVE